MSSDSYRNVLEYLLSDAQDLIGAHESGRTGTQGRQWNLAGVNRAIVVISVSAWEAYVENVTIEATGALRPADDHLGNWPALMAAVKSAAGKFNTPNAQNVIHLVRNSIGLDDVSRSWQWQGTPREKAKVRLEKALKFRHQIAHGVRPRPTIRHQYASGLPKFFEKLAESTDRAICNYLSDELGTQLDWY